MSSPELPQPTPERARDPETLKNIAMVCYALQTAGLVFWVPFVVAAMIAYLKRDDAQGTWIASHLRWQVRTFWFGLAGMGVGWVLHFILIGYLVMGITVLWLIYRIVKGWLFLYDRRPIEME